MLLQIRFNLSIKPQFLFLLYFFFCFSVYAHFLKYSVIMIRFLGHCLPSNPWLTSDTDRWNLTQPLYVFSFLIFNIIIYIYDVHIYIEWRIQLNFVFVVGHLICKELLSDPTGIREFMRFCKADFSTESLNFYLHVQEIRNCSLSQIKHKADVVYRFVFYKNKLSLF